MWVIQIYMYFITIHVGYNIYTLRNEMRGQPSVISHNHTSYNMMLALNYNSFILCTYNIIRKIRSNAL